MRRTPHEYMLNFVYDTWDELNWRWWEEINNALLDKLAEVGTEVVIKEDTKFCAMAAPDNGGGTRFTYPTAFYLNDPRAYFQATVMGRHLRRYHRTV